MLATADVDQYLSNTETTVSYADMLLKAIYLQIAVLFLTALWLIFSKRRSLLDTFFKTSAIMVLILGLWLGGVWFYPPVYGLFLFGLVIIGLIIWHLRKDVSKTSRWRNVLSNIPLIVLLPLGGYLFLQGFTGRLQPDADFIELTPPFKINEGTCVLSGGLSPLLNFHNFPSQEPRDIAQTYGLDFIKTRSNGFRTTLGNTLNPKPKTPEQYEMFNTAVFSPCDGLVVEYENGLPDQPIGGSDKVNTGGNGIVLACGKYHVHLHHLKQGSVIPQLGEVIEAGQKVGEIGNSGNTIEPHLHLHAETIVESGNTNRHGKPVHMRFNGRFMARGDCF